MSLKIRLSRAGAKKRPFYRVVVADTRSPRDGRFLERLGTYDPMLPKDHPERVRLNEERVRHWLGVGALPSDRVARFLGAAEIIPMPAQRNNPQKGQPRAKALERAAARAGEGGGSGRGPGGSRGSRGCCGRRRCRGRRRRRRGRSRRGRP